MLCLFWQRRNIRFNEPYRHYDFRCCVCGANFEIDTLTETEDLQADFLRGDNQKCFDCLEQELHRETEKA